MRHKMEISSRQTDVRQNEGKYVCLSIGCLFSGFQVPANTLENLEPFQGRLAYQYEITEQYKSSTSYNNGSNKV